MLLTTFSLFIYQTLDALDGKQVGAAWKLPWLATLFRALDDFSVQAGKLELVLVVRILIHSIPKLEIASWPALNSSHDIPDETVILVTSYSYLMFAFFWLFVADTSLLISLFGSVVATYWFIIGSSYHEPLATDCCNPFFPQVNQPTNQSPTVSGKTHWHQLAFGSAL